MRRTSLDAQRLAALSGLLLLTVVTAGNAYGMDHSGNINSDETWYAADNPHVVTGTIHVYDGATLTIEPGAIVRFDPGTGLFIGYYSAATLIATGTAGSSISFASNVLPPAPGDWQGIVFYNSTVDGATVLDYCTVEFGGYGWHNSNVYCSRASPTIRNSFIQHSDGYGIYADDDSAPTLMDNTLSDNSSFAISESSGNLDGNVTGNMGSGNVADAIEVRGGDVTSSHTWAAQGLHFNVTDDIDVFGGATLTIGPGSVVKFSAGTRLSIGYFGAATLVAAGTTVSPIAFTSDASFPAPGGWEGIVFYDSTVDGSTLLDYCTVEYGGYGSNNSNVYCSRASPTIQNSIIQRSDGYGIYADTDSAPTLRDNTLSGNSSFAISEACSNLDGNVTGNTGSGNGADAIEVRGGDVTSSHTWVAQGLHFKVTDHIDVFGDATLTIGPGSVVKFSAGTGLSIGYFSAAALIAAGTAVSPITFTADALPPAPGQWKGIVFYDSTVDGSTFLDYCTIEYGGYGGNNSNVYCSRASPTIQNSTIQHSDEYGIYADDDSTPTLTDNTMRGNGSFAISEACSNLDGNVMGNTGSGNGADAIEVRGGDVTSSRSWVAQDLYFDVTDNIHVFNEATLTIEPGAMVKFSAGTGLSIGYFGEATLIAAGTAVRPITFTSDAMLPMPGDWRGIAFYASTVDALSVLEYCVVEYGGSGSINSNIDCNRASPAILHSIIRKSDGHGIYVTEGSPLISCSEMTGNKHGIYVGSGNPSLSGNSITGNSAYGAYNAGPATIVAEKNWWGDSSGPSGVGPGTGDAVNDFIHFTPWLFAFDSCLGRIVLSPAFAESTVGSEHTVSARVSDESGDPVQGTVVLAEIISGPHAGEIGTGTTDALGEVAFTYTGTAEGTDTIVARFVDFHRRTILSHAVTETWGPINNPPVARCRNVTTPAGGDCRGDASVDDGSFDPDGDDTLTLSQLPGGPYPLGTTAVTLTVTDNHGASDSCQATVTVVDAVGPTLTLNPSLTFWAPSHKYRNVTVSEMVAGVSDSCSSLSMDDVLIESVTSDEPRDVPGDTDGDTISDIIIAANCKSVQVRRERDGAKNGRVYVVTLRAMDASGNPVRAEFKVTVPLNQSDSLAVQDAGAYTVTGSCP